MKMTSFLKGLSALMFTLILCSAHAVHRDIRFQRLSVEEGLSQSTVTAIAQDGCGNLWLGTQDGLNCYDSYGFKAYHANPSDSLAIADNSIFALCTTADNRLWIGTSQGLSHYDFSRQCFVNYSLNGKPTQVLDILELEQELLLASDDGIYRFNPKIGQAENFLSGIHVRSLHRVLERDLALAATSNGAYAYSLERHEAYRTLSELAAYDLSSIVEATDGGFWIATHGNGLFRVDAQLQPQAHYLHATHPALASDYIRVLKRDEKGQLWIGTYDGLSLLDERNGTLSRYTHSADPASISHNSVWSICIDRQQGVWLGTYYGGVNYYHPQANKFSVLRCIDEQGLPLEGTVSCIVNDPASGDLWIGTNDDGVFRYEVASGHFTRYNETSVEVVDKVKLSDNIKCILPDGDEDLYVGTHIGGLSHLNTRTRRVENFRISHNSPINNGCYSLLEEDDNTLWVGTLCGLFSFDKARRQFTRHPAAEHEPALASRQIMTLFRDSKERVWVGTDAGLYLCSARGFDVRALKGLKINQGEGTELGEPFVLCVTEDSAQRFWIGTKQGLYQYDESRGELIRHTIDDGLPNNLIYGILEDDLHRLWISTNNGLCCFDPQAGIFRNYHRSEGIANNQFNNYAYCRDRDGNFYFGGLGGITTFRPQVLRDNPYSPTPHICDLTLLNGQAEKEALKAERTSDGRVHKASFSSRMNIFTIRFSTSNPLSGGRNTYRYTLEGFDGQWYETQNREVSYSNLAPGAYTFRLRSANNDGLWSDEEATLQLRIRPRWWQTLGARMGFVGLVLGLLWLVGHFLTQRMKMELLLKMERKEKEHIEALSQEKIRFYINLSHELRTPLTLILSPLQEIEEHGAVDKYVQNRLGYIYRSSTKLLHLVNQILDYRKAELGIYKLQVAEQNVEALAGEVFALFEEIAQKRDMDYILNSELKGELLPVDRMFLETILMNLLSNAFKFTPAGGIIKLSLRQNGDKLLISLRDNGVGIPAEKQKRIFERFYRADESVAGNGIGLSIVERLVELHHGEISLQSEEGSFTEFTLSLPALPEAYAPEERRLTSTPPVGPSTERLSTFLAEVSAQSEELPTEGLRSDEEERETLLLVVEESEVRRYLNDHFRNRYRILTAGSGAEALDLLKQTEPDVIIADRVLTGMDGLKFCSGVKQNIRTCHIPVIIIASKDSEEDQITGFEAGADDYVGQPFSINLLQAKVQNLLKSRYRLRRYYSNSQEIEPEKITSNTIDGEFLKRAIQVVEENMDNEDFSSSDFAQALCMSRSNLHLKMTSITGESATKFIRKIRFNHACKLLQDRKYTIAEISSMVGFNSPSYFATSFKKHVGCLPTEYLRTHPARSEEKEER